MIFRQICLIILALKNFEVPLMKVINLLVSLLFLSACTGRVSPEKIAGLNFYIDNQFVYEPILTGRFTHEYLKDCTGVYDFATYAPPVFVFRNEHVAIYFYREGLVTTILGVTSSESLQIRRSTTKSEQLLYDEFVCKYLNL